MRQITLSQKDIAKILKDAEKRLHEVKIADDKTSFTINLNATVKQKKKAKINFSMKAYIKMIALVTTTSTEIAWHGLVTRRGETFLVEDIIMYPQKVTGGTVNSDDAKYPDWVTALDDATFAKCKMQGHSHVNFAASPSGVDTAFYEQMLQNMDKTDYYIFMIINKSFQTYFNIYDFTKNVMYSDADIEYSCILDNQDSLSSWTIRNKKDFITPTITISSAATTSTYNANLSGSIGASAHNGTRKDYGTFNSPNQMGFQTSLTDKQDEKQLREDTERILVSHKYDGYGYGGYYGNGD